MSSSSTHPFRPIGYPEIVTATDNFAESLIISRDDFWNVYAGHITYKGSLVPAAIKRLDPQSIRNPSEFLGEVNKLSKLCHGNIVSVMGYCIHEEENILVYEYVPNGTLYDLLHMFPTHLSWLHRLNICLDVARGLCYLHGVEPDIVHCDIKSSHILLDENWGAKVSDFGLSKTCLWDLQTTCVDTVVMGNFSWYLDPVFVLTGRMEKKSDVYSFGVLLLEVLCRKPVVSSKTLYGESMSIVKWAKVLIKQGNLKHIVDPEIWDEISPKCLKKVISIATRCLDEHLPSRPTMAEVVADLENVLASQKKFNGSRRGPCSRKLSCIRSFLGLVRAKF